MIIAYSRAECSAKVMRDLYNVGIGRITCYQVLEYAVNGRRFFIRPVHSKFTICRRH